MIISLRKGQLLDRDELLARLIELQYERNDMSFTRSTFRVRGDVVEIFPAGATDTAVRIELFDDELERITEFRPLTGEIIAELSHVAIYPASHYVVSKERLDGAIEDLEVELAERIKYFEDNGLLIEAQRIEQRTHYDIEMLQEIGFCKGIENYSRVIARRAPGSTPYTLLDHFPEDFLFIADESHVSIPQVRGMSAGDRARKDILIQYGFRLPSARDNRPLFFDEFYSKLNQIIYVSATPGPIEREHSAQIAEQIIRPTGLVDPEIIVKPIDGQIEDLIFQIRARTQNSERVLVTTLTKKMAEDLTEFLAKADIRVRYLHHDIDTIERMEIIRDLRLGEFDVLVGINLLREGLDLPEVSLVAILDADKEGFLRSESALIQTVGRAARNVNGQVIMYADTVTKSMYACITETERRRTIQQRYNKEHNITPETIKKDIRDVLEISTRSEADSEVKAAKKQYTPLERQKLIEKLTAEMKDAAKILEFEHAAFLRDKINELKGIKKGKK
jgi:excinuclease ABC subunit B